MKATTIKTITLATVIAVASSLGSTAFAHDVTNAGQDVSAIETQKSISKSNAKHLVKKILKRDYRGQGLKAYPKRIVDGKWQVAIKYNMRTVGSAFVDAKTGRVSPE